MRVEDIKALKYYIAAAAIFLSFYAYSGTIGWKWWFSTKTEETRPEHTDRTHGPHRFYHK